MTTKKIYTQAQAAKLTGVSRAQLNTWVRRRLIPLPESIQIGSRTLRLWRDRDVARLKSFKGTQRPGRKPRAASTKR
jgi:hypothetical protein